MADIKKIATRVSYGNTLVELAQQGADNLVVFDADLAAATKTEIFRKEYPDRHFDCGIAEQNMVGVAAGMATMGYVPFVSSFAMFVAGRGFEQIRNSIGYPHLNVKIAATHAGLSVGEDGASHQCCEDIALMRSIPGMVVLSPADDVEARAAVIAAYNYQGPVYLRFSRLATPVFHDPETYEFQIGKGEKLTDGYDIAVISTGLMTNEALRAAVLAKRQGMNVRVINMPTIKPIDEEIILTAARECGRIITVEEHSIIGGLGEAVCSVVSEKLPVPVRRIGVMDQFGHSGPANEVLRDYGLTADNIVNVIRDIVRPDAKALFSITITTAPNGNCLPGLFLLGRTLFARQPCRAVHFPGRCEHRPLHRRGGFHIRPGALRPAVYSACEQGFPCITALKTAPP